MTNKPRLLWICSHKTARDEDGPLFIDAGFEFIPTGSDLLNDTSNNFWKSNCTISDNILNIVRTDWKSDKAKQYINENFQAVMIAAYPDLVANFLSWYKGFVIFRVYGHGENTTYTNIIKAYGLNLSIFDNEKYIWCPTNSILSTVESDEIKHNEFPINGFVSKNRLEKYKWCAQQSNSKIFEVYSALEVSGGYYAEIYKKFKQYFGNFDYVILGSRNPCGLNGDKHILGALKEAQYYNLMCSCRALIYTGQTNKHLHYHAVEALELGIPVIFSNKSMIAHCCRIFNVKIKNTWAYDTLAEAQNLTAACVSNINLAIEISIEQKEIIDKAFSRKTALIQAQRLLNKITTEET